MKDGPDRIVFFAGFLRDKSIRWLPCLQEQTSDGFIPADRGNTDSDFQPFQQLIHIVLFDVFIMVMERFFGG